MHGFVILMAIFISVAVIDLLIAEKSFAHENTAGKCLGFTCLGAFIVTVSYIASLFIEDYLPYSILSSIYFAGIDFTLISLMSFTWFFTRSEEEREQSWIFRILSYYMVVDCLFLAINPIYEISVTYIPQETVISHFKYEMHGMYFVHLAYTYAIICMVLYYLIRKIIHAPRIYRNQYSFCVFTLLAVVGINAIYLFMPDLFGKEDIDYSLIGYSIGACFFYWGGFRYSTHGLLTHFHSWIFENVDQALVLFDYDDRLILHNQKAAGLLPQGSFDENIRLTDFLKKCGLKCGSENDGIHYSFQCFVMGNPMRCDYSVQLDQQGKRLGRLFVFTEVTTQFDLLTGFRSWTDFKENADDLFPLSNDKQIVAACDINSLTDINRKFGRVLGDRAIQCLAEEMRNVFPSGTFFTRSREASIAAICMDTDEVSVEESINLLQEHLRSCKEFPFEILIQSSVSIREQESIVDTIRRCLQSMRTKKLMDRTSVHSEILLSLLQALSQCDADTGDHVQRTQRTGEQLGRRIGLTDQQQSNLALLAILHDIGKIGIPLEILNKPGKLSDSEWRVLKTHTEKGYQIAKSSQELSEIAEMILYHHERWDGRGYPAGLAGEQIPLLSRIIAVVDAYDAMINTRAYRKALSESAARMELVRGAGTQFDPKIVQEFLAMLEDDDQKQGISVLTMSERETAIFSDFRDIDFAAIPPQKERQHVHCIAYSMYILGSNASIIRTDAQFEVITGYTREDVEALHLTQLDLIFPEDRSEYAANVRINRPNGTDIYLEHRLRRKDDSAVFVYCYGHTYFDSADGEERTRIVIINSDQPFGAE